MIWFLWTAGISVGLVAVTTVIVLWWNATAHRRAERRRISEYLAKMTVDEPLYQRRPCDDDHFIPKGTKCLELTYVQVWPVDD